MGDQKVTYEEVKNLSPGVYLIDVREPNEIKDTGSIPGSINIPMGNVQQELSDLNEGDFLNKYGMKKPNIDSEIIFSCRSGKRAETIMKDIAKLGYSKLKYYPGSWTEWESKR